MKTIRFVVPAFFLLACTSPAPEVDDVASAESAQVSDVISMQRRPDGKFDVVCDGGGSAPRYTEVATSDQIQQNEVCLGPPVPAPSPSSCEGEPWSVAGIEARLPPGAYTALLPSTLEIIGGIQTCTTRSGGVVSCGDLRPVTRHEINEVKLSLTASQGTASTRVSATRRWAWRGSALTLSCPAYAVNNVHCSLTDHRGNDDGHHVSSIFDLGRLPLIKADVIVTKTTSTCTRAEIRPKRPRDHFGSWQELTGVILFRY